MDSMKNIFVKSNSLFKLPEKDDNMNKIPETGGVDKEHDCGRQDVVYHKGIVNRAFLPMRIALIAMGRWPYHMRFEQVTSTTKRKNKTVVRIDDGGVPPRYEEAQNNNKHYYRGTLPPRRVRNYQSSLRSVLWIYFGISTVCILYVLIMSTFGALEFFLSWDILKCCQSESKRKIFQNNLVIFLLVWGCMVHSTLSSFSFLTNRKKVVRILNYWNVAADELLLEQTKSHRRFLITANIGYLVFLVLIYAAYSAWRIALVREGAELFGSLAVLPLLKIGGIEGLVEKWQLRVFGICTMIYVIYASRAFLFLFSFKCRILQSLFRDWNSRLIRFLKRPTIIEEKGNIGRESVEKVECQRLLYEMTILLKLVKQTDKMFAIILQAYYAIQLLNMCFELYMLAKSGTADFMKAEKENGGVENADDGRGLNIMTAVLTLIQNVYFFFTVSLDGAYVGEEAAKGMEALRRHPLNPNSSVHKKYLVYNLGFIYNQRITLTGGKYFNIDRPFILAVLGAVLTYFVIILQVGQKWQQQEIEAIHATANTNSDSTTPCPYS